MSGWYDINREATVNRRIRNFLLGVAGGGLLLAQAGMAFAQSSAPARITKAVDSSVRVKLHGSVPGAAQAQFDQGSAAPTARLDHVYMLLSRSPEQEAALTERMSEQLDPSSPNYHKWLTPEQLGQQYGVAQSDIAKITAWLQSQGLTVSHVSKAHTSIEFGGSVAQVEQALQVSIHNFNNGTQKFLAPVNDPQLPLAFAPVVGGVARLDTIQPVPQIVNHGQAKLDPATHGITQAATPSPQLTTNGRNLHVTAADAQTIYDVPNATYNPNYTGPTYDGKGVTIGIGGTALISMTPIANYYQQFLGQNRSQPIQVVNDYGATLQSDGEAYLDVEVSGGLAPGATIRYYPSPDLFSGIIQAADDNAVDVFSLSYLVCEAWGPQSENVFFAQTWQQFAAQGISVVAASGDAGASGCDSAGAAQAKQGLRVSALSGTPYNISVGGTDFIGLVTGTGPYQGGNGPYYRSALGYIPESPWNDSSWPNGDLANNKPLIYVVGGGGGASNCWYSAYDSTGKLNCYGGLAKPYWQAGPGVPDDGVRDQPDVALFAGNGVYGASWAYCTDAADCGPATGGSIGLVGGTSAATPAFAGILADAVQKTGGRLGLAADTLYKLARTPGTKSAFHDVTVGNNSMMCTQGTLNCALNSAGNYFLTGYNATPGYDLASGLGSVDAAVLINDWQNANTGGEQATVTLKPSSATVSSSQNLSITVTVTGAGGVVPTGTLTLSTTTYGSKPVKLNPQGTNADSATFTLSPNDLQLLLYDAFGPGTYDFIATYSGDGTYSPATGSVSVTINQ